VYGILGRNWWALLVRGIAAIVFGILAIAWPGHALVALALLFGAYALVDGVFALVAAFRAAERHAHWLVLVAEGLLGIVAGIIVLASPGIAIFVFAYIAAAWAIITGVLEIVAAVRLRRELAGEILLILAGVVSVLFGILLAAFPGAGVLAIVWIIGIYALIFGVMLIALSFRLRTWHHGGNGRVPAAPV
jgi:uncharacterized membrane protein HdeD (DUF308 family)